MTGPNPSAAPAMRGPAGVRHDIAAFFRDWLPDHARACAEVWGVPVEVPVSRPDNDRVDGYFERDPAAIDRWPMLSVSSGRRTQSELDRDHDGSPLVTATYPIRVFTWVRHEGWDATQDARDNLATAVQVAVLSHVELGTSYLYAVPSTLVVDFSNVEKVKGERYVAGSFVGFDVRATEALIEPLSLPRLPEEDRVGTVDSVFVTGRVLPPLGG